MDSRARAVTHQVGAFRRRVAWVFGLQLATVAVACVLGFYEVLHAGVAITLIVLATALAWLVIRRAWRPVRRLARLVDRWKGEPQDPDLLAPERMSTRTDADIVALAQGLHGFATRIADYNERERNFTRDASHELRSPLTVIKMSVDMLGEEEGLSEFGVRSVRRIRRAAREMEVLVEALLILAREADGADNERFVVNDVLRREMEFARDLLAGRPIELVLEEPARFAIEGSTRAFSVQCWQLIRNACQQTEQGRVVVVVSPGAVSVSNHADAQVAAAGRPQRLHGADRHGFELAIAQRISDRFGWPLELKTRAGAQNIACIRFPHSLPAEPEPPAA